MGVRTKTPDIQTACDYVRKYEDSFWLSHTHIHKKSYLHSVYRTVYPASLILQLNQVVYNNEILRTILFKNI